MAGYFDSDNSSSTIIRDEKPLLPDYLPDDVLQRERELQYIADCIKPLLKRNKPQNLFIYGPSGTGKTTCLKYLIRELLEQSSSVLPVYINCWENTTQLAIYNRIIEEMRLPVPRRGHAPDEIFDKIMQFIKNYKKPVLLVLDEMDAIRNDELLYVISRANEKQISFGIVGISNNKSLISKLDPRIKSTLRFSDLEFGSYDEDQLFSILRVRAERALSPGSFDERLLLKIARSVDDGSARNAIERLWNAAKKAEQARREKIMIQDFEDVLASQSEFKKQELNLSEEETLLLEILKSGEMDSTKLYSAFSKKYDKTKRQIRNYLDSLEQKGLVESREIDKGMKFNSKIFKLTKRG